MSKNAIFPRKFCKEKLEISGKRAEMFSTNINENLLTFREYWITVYKCSRDGQEMQHSMY